MYRIRIFTSKFTGKINVNLLETTRIETVLRSATFAPGTTDEELTKWANETLNRLRGSGFDIFGATRAKDIGLKPVK